MTNEEIKSAIEAGLAEVKSKVETATKTSADEVKAISAQLETIQNQIEEAKKSGVTLELVEKMQDHLDKLDVKLQKKSVESKAAPTLDNELKAKFEEKAIADAINELKNNRGAAVNMDVKAVTSMTLGSYVGTSLTTEIDRSISAAPQNMPLFRNIVNVSTIRGNKVTWINKEAVEGAAGVTAEGAAKSQVSWTYTEESADVKKITAYVKVSKEALDDLDFLRSEINTDLRTEIELKLDEHIAEGSGLTVNLKGIKTYAPAFAVAGTSLASAVDNANRLDALRAAVALVRRNKFRANYIAINPVDAALMDMEKGTDGHYILPPFVTADGTRVAGTTVIESFSIDEGEFLAGDFTKSNLRIREEININLGYENDDFTKNMVTILAEMRAVHYIKKHHVKAFVKGTFAAAIAAIDSATPTTTTV